MICDLYFTGKQTADGRYLHRCRRCNHQWPSKQTDSTRIKAPCRAPAAGLAAEDQLSPYLEEVEVEARLAVCRACPSGHYRDGYCVVCPSCRSLKKANFERLVRLRFGDCPLHLWPSPVYVNLDPIGWGDLAIFAYIALGTRQTRTPLIICATGEKARHARLLGCEPADPAKDARKWTAFTAEMEHYHEGGTLGRLEFYADHYRVPRLFVKPTLAIPDEDLAFARSLGIDRRTVLLFPDSLSPNRVWPKQHYWNELADRLAAHGLKSLTLPIGNFEWYRNAVDVRPMVRVAACMSLAGLAVGNDSACINWTPLVDLPALCLLGPTPRHIFQHAPLVRCITGPPLPYNATSHHAAGADCAGCAYHFKHNPFCSQVCMSLANLLPEQACAEAVKYHAEVWR